MVCASLYDELCSFRNLELAYRKARRGKSGKSDVREFGLNVEENLLRLKHELEALAYEPRPLKQFTIRDPKTRLISASHFRDRVVHHALCNVIQPVFEKGFIHDSYANRIGKGTHAALRRFDEFKRKVSQNGRLVNHANDGSMVIGYALKADIRHYFGTVDHKILMKTLEKRIRDELVLALIQKILDNHATSNPGKGMPIGNLTSQFFANVYLNELDYFVKHELGAKFYIRYVDDFIIMHESEETLARWKEQISSFLGTLEIELHPEKSKICPIRKGVIFLGFRVFYHHKLLKKSNLRQVERRIGGFEKPYRAGELPREKVIESFESWMAFAGYADTYKLRKSAARRINMMLAQC